METITIKIEKEVLITQEDINDIMDCALEGGIIYWCGLVERVEDNFQINFLSEQIGAGGSLKLYDAESDDTWVLTKDKLLEGIKLYLSKDMDVVNEDGSLATDEIDADIADQIVQYALFGKVVFG